MSFDWLEYLYLAQELTGQSARSSTQEAKSRSAASRAYYAAFCKARNFLRAQKNVHIPNTGRAHRLVWQWFEGNSSDEVKQIGVEGNRLKEDRRKADYDDAVPNLSSLATEALELSGKIIANLTEIDELNHR